MQHRRGHDSCALSSSARDPPIRHLLICRPVTDGRRLLICTSIALVRLPFCTPITLVRGLLICTSITLLRRLLVCIGSTRLLTCSPGTCVRGLLTCTTTNHPCVIPVGENRVASKGNVAGERGRRRENGRIYHRTGRSRPDGIRSRSERVQHNRDRWRSDRQRPSDVSDRVVRGSLARRDNCIGSDIYGAL